MRGDAGALPHDPEGRFITFYDSAVRDVYRYLMRATAGDRGRAEDLTQETFLAAVQAFNAGKSEAFTMPWIMVVARHKLVDDYRRQAREQRKLVLVSNNAGRDDVALDLHELTEQESIRTLRDLAPLHRLVLTLRYLDDLPVADVAQLLGRSVAATQSLLVRARTSLAQKLDEVGDV